ncbi:MAG: glycosyltransferase [Bacteroidetes bacterium]|nr:glycosyltransferase [Bacteroidota bacterium]MDA1269622.1 glycosyltransferase [Bacteroidota bacterium]
MPKLLLLSTEPITFKLLLSGLPKLIKEQGWEVLLVSADGREVHQICRAEGVLHEVIPFVKGVNYVEDFISFWPLFQLIRRERPDVIHSYDSKAGFLGMLAAKLAGVPHRIHSITQMPTHAKEPQKGFTFREKWTYSNATSLWVISSGMLSFFTSNSGIETIKFNLLGSGSTLGINLEKFNRQILKENHLVAATMRILPGENDFIILAVGKLTKRKGVEDLVAAFLQSKIVSMSKLVLIGTFEQDEDPISQETMQFIREHPRLVQIDWTDHVAHHLALADVLVQASQEEGFSNVLLEAAAMQVPIICSNCIGNTSFIKQQKTGLVFPLGEVTVLKEALEFAYVKREVLTAYADTLFEEVQEKFDRKLICQLQVDAYCQMLKNQE